MGPASSQSDVYKEVGKQALDWFIDGFSCSILVGPFSNYFVTFFSRHLDRVNQEKHILFIMENPRQLIMKTKELSIDL